MSKNRWLSIVSAMLCFSLGFQSRAGAVGANGLSAQVVGARALGMGNAYVGMADDPTANFLNPAGLTQLEGWQATLGLSPTLLTSDYSAPGKSESLKQSWTVLPNFFLTGKLNDRLSVGFGIHVPYGLGTEWSKTGNMRYVATKSNLGTLLYNPNVAYNLSDKITLAAGVDYLQILDATLESQVNFGLGGSDGSQKLKGDGGSWGYNIAALWKPFAKHSFGASYRSQQKTKIKGDLSLTNIDPIVAGALSLPVTDYSASVETEIPFAQTLILGYSFRPSDKWVWNFDYEWTDWSKFKQFKVNSNDPVLVALNATAPIDYSWKDCHSVALGTEYTMPNQLKLRGGYSYYTSVVPERTWNPSLPENNVHNLSIGAGYPIKKVTLDFAYFVDWYENRKVDSAVGDAQTVPASIDGTYKTKIHVIALSATYKF